MRRFLVVDDSPTVRLMMRSAIRKAEPDAVVDEAADPAAALATFESGAPAVVFLDLVLANGATGATALEAILRIKPDARIVVVTGLPPDSAPVVEAISRGASGMIQKPVRVEAVREILATLQQESSDTVRIR